MFRLATSADIPFLLELQDRPENLPAFGGDDAEGWQRYIDTPSFELLIWQPAEAPMGLALLTKGRLDPTVVELSRFGLAVQNTGEGGRALPALFDYVFEKLSAHRLYLFVATDNLRAERVYQRIGMTHEGTMRQHWLRRLGDRTDVHCYAMLAAEWRAAAAA